MQGELSMMPVAYTVLVDPNTKKNIYEQYQ